MDLRRKFMVVFVEERHTADIHEFSLINVKREI